MDQPAPHPASRPGRLARLLGAGRGSRRRGLPEDGLAIVERHLAVWQLLDDDERERLLQITDHLLSRKHWEAARGFVLDDTVRVVVAAQAALLVLNLGTEQYRLVSAIVVHPSTLQTHGERPGFVPGTATSDRQSVLGLAQSGRGPVVLAWDQSLAGAHRTFPGHNVVLHEFAHKLDMLDGTVDGTPVLPRSVAQEWARVCTEVYADLVAGRRRPPLRWYGATNPGEFFAVATEVFFEQPQDLAEHEPALYDLLARFYRQDPAARERASRRSPPSTSRTCRPLSPPRAPPRPRRSAAPERAAAGAGAGATSARDSLRSSS
jgi:Mlc titration factor MtfA (ptsG expression regulator)